MKKRKKYTPEKKAEIVIKVLKEEQTLVQIASEYGIHPNQIGKWKAEFLKSAPMIFTNDHKAVEQLKAMYEKKLNELYGNIGRLSTQVNWLKKKIWNYTGVELSVWI
jgi:transposase-like protein